MTQDMIFSYTYRGIDYMLLLCNLMTNDDEDDDDDDNDDDNDDNDDEIKYITAGRFVCSILIISMF